MPTIIAAHDLSGVGRCSLTTALAVLPVMSHTCYPLPTAVLSQQTGLEGFSFLDFTPYMSGYLDAWRGLDLEPDMIYTGFLGGVRQFEFLSAFIAEHPEATVVIDPVMGDNCEIYDCYDEDFVLNMRKFAESAHILIPNATEFNLLCGRQPAHPFPDSAKEALTLALRINAPKLRYIVVTSALMITDSLWRGKGNLLIDIKNKTVEELPVSHNGISYNGAGDLFASVLCGLVLDGVGIRDAIRAAGDFVSDVVKAMPSDADPKLGVGYEAQLIRLFSLRQELINVNLKGVGQ